MNNNIYWVRIVFAKLFTLLFLGLTVSLIFSLMVTVINGISKASDFMPLFLSSINTVIIALALFELALVINREYSGDEEDEGNAVAGLRRTIPRFIGLVCIALSLEGLIMVIKYSQLELAGNLYYPVAIITSAALLLSALALFLHLTRE